VLAGGVAALGRNIGATRIAAWSSVRSLLRGLWTSLGVIAALQVLGMGESGFGILMLAAGLGTLVAVPLTRTLVGRAGLAGPFMAALALCAGALAGVGASANADAAVALLVLWGLGMAVADAVAQALLNRVVDVRALAPAVGATEVAKLASEGLGAMLAPAAAGLVGVRGALIASGALILLALDRANFLSALSGLEPAEGVPPRSPIEALARQPLLSGASHGSLAALADAASPLALAAGETIVSKGHDDDRWFVVLDGQVIVHPDGRPPRRLLPGDSFGEIGVLHERPRTATVVAGTRAHLIQVPGRQLRGALAAAG
jgi:hypothetical protein